MQAGERMPWGPLLAVLGAGVVAHLVLAANADPEQFDTRSFLIMADALKVDPLQAYDTMRFPYPPGFAPWLLVSTSTVNDVVPFDVLLRLPMIAASIGIAYLVQDVLGMRGATERTRLLAAGAVALGPVFLAIAGFHGQIDTLAILPGVAALWLWERGGSHRALTAGVLIGIGAALKTVPIFLLIPLVLTASDRRERLHAVIPALVVPALAIAPFVVANPDGTIEALRDNRGIPGFGGLSLLLVHPDISELWAKLGINSGSLASGLTDIQQWIAAAAAIAAGAVARARRLDALQCAALVWLAILAVNPNFAWQYLVWGLPFFLMAGFVREVVAFQVIASLPLVLFYLPGDLSERALDLLYLPSATAVWLLLVAALVLVLRATQARPSPNEEPA